MIFTLTKVRINSDVKVHIIAVCNSEPFICAKGHVDTLCEQHEQFLFQEQDDCKLTCKFCENEFLEILHNKNIKIGGLVLS